MQTELSITWLETCFLTMRQIYIEDNEIFNLNFTFISSGEVNIIVCGTHEIYIFQLHLK